MSVRREFRAMDQPSVNYDKVCVSEITSTRFSVVDLDGHSVFADDPMAILRYVSQRDPALIESYGSSSRGRSA